MKVEIAAWSKWPLPSPSDDVDMWEWQDGRCAWHGGRPTQANLVEDHCHMTGLVRGYLCRRCNIVEGKSFDPAWDEWREGDNPAFALKEFRIYVGWGGTPISPQSALNYYSRAELNAWFEQIPGHLEGGAPWPTDAPWIETAIARRDHAEARLREAFGHIFPNTDGKAS